MRRIRLTPGRTLIGVVGLCLCTMLVAFAASLTVKSQDITVSNTTVSVPKSSPSVSTTPSSGGPAGATTVTDSATLSNDTNNAGGQLTFILWDHTCATQIGSNAVTVNSAATNTYSSGTTPSSGTFAPTLAGTYYWTTSYNGDANNNAIATSTCGVSGESVVLTNSTSIIDLNTEVKNYNSTHQVNGTSSGTPDFSFFSGADGFVGGSVTWTPSSLTDKAMTTYTASSNSTGKWGGTAGSIGPFTTSPFNGVAVTPDPINPGGQHGAAAVTRLTIPAAPSGNYQSGATIQVQTAWTAGAGSSLYVYLVNSSGTVVGGGTNPVQVKSGSPMNTTFAITTPSTGTVYYVAIAPTNNTPTTVALDVTASLPYH